MVTVSSTELINAYNFTSANITTWLNLLVGHTGPDGAPAPINIFIFRLNAFSEWNQGTSGGISTARAMIQAASARGISVVIDLHTWYTTWDNYFRDAALNHDANRVTYINFVRTVIRALNDLPVYAYHVLNEPQARVASSSENQFILDVVAAAKQETNRPIGVRFMAGYSPDTGHYASAINQAVDLVCRNIFWDARDPTRTVYGCSQNTILNGIAVAHALGKPYWNTEFGAHKDNLENQRSYVAALVQWSIAQSIDAQFCWASQPSQAGEDYNIFSGFTPHPAWYELLGGEAPPVLPPKRFVFWPQIISLFAGLGLVMYGRKK